MGYIDESIILDDTFNEYFSSVFESEGFNAFANFLELSRNQNFSPDINGYTLIYMVPPNLSGAGGTETLTNMARQFPFLAIDFTPPETTVKSTEETSGASIGIPYSTGTSSGGQLSINYIEDSNLNVVNYHNTWVTYMGDVIYGRLSPSEHYIDTGELDYATSAYVVKFKPDMKTLTYVGKATGLFPTNVPSKEIIGNRQSNELSMVGCNYVCAMYTAYVAGGIKGWVLEHLESDLAAYFQTNVPQGGGSPTNMSLTDVLSELGIQD